MRSLVRRLSWLTASAVLVVAGIGALTAAAAQGGNITVEFQCLAAPQDDTSQTFTATVGTHVSAPERVSGGDSLEISVASDAVTVPTTMNGYGVASIRDVELTLHLSSPASINDVTLSGGSALGDGAPQVTFSGNDVVLDIPGPISAGTTFNLPGIDMELTAGRAGYIVSSFTGAGFSNPDVTFTADVLGGDSLKSVPVACNALPTRELSRTLIY